MQSAAFGRHLIAIALFSILALPSQANDPPATPEVRTPEVRHEKGRWVNISDPIVNHMKEDGVKIGYPGQTGGIAVDESSGAVFMVVCGQGLWKSMDHGSTFARCDGNAIGGRCETGFSLNLDPAGKRLACFMLDGHAGLSLDNGTTWKTFKDVGRNWDYAAVDWSAATPENIFASRHESGGELFLSNDTGVSWRQFTRNPKLTCVGIFDANTLVTSNGEGVALSTDGGKNWQKTSSFTPLSRVMRVVNGVGWWISDDGLITSKDKGQTWEKVGMAVAGTLGPYFDPKNPKHMLVAGQKGFFETTDGAATWEQIAKLPEGFDLPRAGWFTNVGWDPTANILYASRMGKPAFKLER